MRYIWCYPLFLGVFGLDRLSKWWIIASGIVSKKITPWLTFDLQLNRGVSWGFLHSLNEWVFIGVTLCVIAITAALAVYAWCEAQHNRAIYGQVMVLAGSLSNILDRIMYGGVIDFIHMHFKQWSFAVFNIADVAIVLGVFIMMMQVVLDDNES